MSDRSQVARETLASANYKARIAKAMASLGKAWPVLADHASHIDGEFSSALYDVQRLVELVNEAHPAPAAPVTVTVEGYSVSPVVREDGLWRDADGRAWHDSDSTGRAPLFARIASDARRIAELERERDEARRLYAEREAQFHRESLQNVELQQQLDNSRRQLEYSFQLQRLIEWLDRGGVDGDDALVRRDLCKHHAQKADRIALRLQAATSQGEGQQERLAAVAPSPASAEEKQGSPPAPVASSPAPIPLGAVVESVQYEYRFGRYTHDWECMQGDPPVGLPVDVEISALCTALYRALHPVADAATADRIALRLQAATSQGEGLGAAALNSEREAGEESSATVAAAPKVQSHSPAPIPLGATLHVKDDPDAPYERVAGGWIRVSTDTATRVQGLAKVYQDDDAAWGNMLTQYYRALHPVADAATVERVAKAIYAENISSPWEYTSDELHEECRNDARAALRALGYTIQEGEA